MRIVIHTSGSRGDVQPYCGLALGLQSQGHSVLLSGPSNFETLVRGLGLDYAPMPLDSHALLTGPEPIRLMAANDTLRFMRLMAERCREQWPAIWQSMRDASEGADILIGTSVTDLLVASLAEATGSRLALAYLIPNTPTRTRASYALGGHDLGLGAINHLSQRVVDWAWWRMNRVQVNAARSVLGLAASSGSPVTRARRTGKTLVLHGYSPTLVPRPRDWSALELVTGAWRLPASAAQSLPGDHQDAGFQHWLEESSPPLYLSFGSLPMMDGRQLLELAADVSEDLGVRILIGAGWTKIDVDAHDLPDDVAISEACDHEWLFPQCALVAHHCGAGTTHTASASGVPQITMPIFADQPFWARQVQRQGAGIRVPYRQLSVDRLESAIDEALQEKTQVAAADLGQALQAENGVKNAVEAIERWAKHGS